MAIGFGERINWLPDWIDQTPDDCRCDLVFANLGVLDAPPDTVDMQMLRAGQRWKRFHPALTVHESATACCRATDK